jgi:hypothetical protein
MTLTMDLKMKKTKKEKNRKQIPVRKFNIETINGIEIAHASITKDEIISDENALHIEKLSDIATRRFHVDGRGSFLIVTESSPNQAVYLSTNDLLKCINQLIPEALSKVNEVVSQYDPQEQFVVINVFNNRRVAITTEIMRFRD